MISFEDFKKMEIKIADVEAVEPHPNADKLYVIQIRVGEIPKKIVAGIRRHYRADELLGKKIVVVDNLPPTTIRGVESQAMLLAACAGDDLALIVPERPIGSGAAVR